jgi:hypothetical protein
LTASRTLDSLIELQSTKLNTPSINSSGYGSEAVSSTNLTNDDCISIKSISVDETPDFEYKYVIDSKKYEKKNSSLIEETFKDYLHNVNSKIEEILITQDTCLNKNKQEMSKPEFIESCNDLLNIKPTNNHKKCQIEFNLVSKSSDDTSLEGYSDNLTRHSPEKV